MILVDVRLFHTTQVGLSFAGAALFDF